MSTLFRHEYQAQWRDMDFNQHMANSAFLDYAGNTRTLFSAAGGFTVARFAELQFGPVILEDRLTYKREIRLLESFTVDVQLAASTQDGRRFKIRNRFHTGEDVLCAVVDSIGLWLDLTTRTPRIPPDELRDAWLSAGRTDDFEDWG